MGGEVEDSLTQMRTRILEFLVWADREQEVLLGIFLSQIGELLNDRLETFAETNDRSGAKRSASN